MNTESNQADVLPDIRITDPYLKAQVKAEQDRRGDGTATKTAGRLITERLSQLELQQSHGRRSRRRTTA